MPVGTRISLSGRIQSRVYQKTSSDGSVEDRTAYEVSVSKIALNTMHDNIEYEEIM